MFHTASVQHQNRSRKIIIIMQNLKRTFLQLLWIFRSRPLKKISHFTQGSQSTNHVFIFVRSSKLVSVNHSKKKLKRIFCLSSNFCWPALGVLIKGVPKYSSFITVLECRCVGGWHSAPSIWRLRWRFYDLLVKWWLFWVIHLPPMLVYALNTI